MKDFELIENFILGKLDEEQTDIVRERLKSDKDFRQYYEEIKDFIVAIQADGLKESLKGRKIDDKVDDKIIHLNADSARNPRRVWLVAASLAMLLTFGWLLYTINAPINQSRLMAEAFYSDPGLPTKMSATKHYDFYDEMVDYKTEDYESALNKWSSSTDGIGPDTLEYYKSMALLNLRKLEEAESGLKLVPQSSRLYNQAQWRLLEIAIRNQDFTHAREIFNNLPEDSYPKYDLVKDFLKKR